MVTYYVNKNDNYKVIATVSCEVLDGDNNLIGTCSSGETLTFKAPTSKISISDDNAVLTRNIESSVGTGDVDKHVCDPSIHCTPEEKESWNAAVDGVETTLTELETKVNKHIVDTDVHVTDGDRTKWDKKLDPSALYVKTVINVDGTGNGNVNTYGFTYKAPRSGYVTGLSCCCHTTQGASTQAESGKILIKLWRADGSLLAVSVNSLEHTAGAVLHYWFVEGGVFVNKGELIYVTFHEEGNADSTTYADGMVECYMESVALTSNNQGGLLGSNGNISNTTSVVKHTWFIDAEKFTQVDHSDDEGKHLRDGERESWNAKANENHTHTASDITGLDVGVKRIDYWAGKGAGVSIHSKSETLTSVSSFSDDYEYKATKDVCLIYTVGNSPGSGYADDFKDGFYYNYPLKLCMNVKVNGTYYACEAASRRVCSGGIEFIEVHLKSGDAVKFSTASVSTYTGYVRIKLLEFNYR